MLNQLQIKRYSYRLQVEFRTLSKICKKLYYKYAPSRLTHRRNASLVKVPDYEIIALLVWQAEEGISSQRRFARCWGLCGLSRSRFNRRARALLGITAQIVNDLKSRVDLFDQYMIIDSLPMPLCQPIRNRRAKVFEGTANIGYNSTKKFYYYGFKGHVSQDGYVLGYVITKINISWYYFTKSGKMVKGKTVKSGAYTYTLNKSGYLTSEKYTAASENQATTKNSLGALKKTNKK